MSSPGASPAAAGLKKKGLIFTPEEAAEKSKHLPKGYALVVEPVVAQLTQTPEQLPAKRQRKKNPFTDFVTLSPSSNATSTSNPSPSPTSTPSPTPNPNTHTSVVPEKPAKKKTGRPKKVPVEQPVPQAAPGVQPNSSVDSATPTTSPLPSPSSSSSSSSKKKSGSKKKKDSEPVQTKRPRELDSTEVQGRPKLARLQSSKKETAELSEELKRCLEVLQSLMAHKLAWPFTKPVDPVEWDVPDYFDVIKNPMDLGTVKEQLLSGFYVGIEDFADDVRLVFNNSMTYNQPKSSIWNMAHKLLDVFEKNLAQTQKSLEKDTGASMEDTLSELRKSMKQVREEVQRLRQQKPKTPNSKNKALKEMTNQEKKKLGEYINQLPGDKLGRVVQIIRETEPMFVKTLGQDEIEIDLDVLGTKTLRSLEEYAISVLHPPKSKKKKASTIANEQKAKAAAKSETNTEQKISDELKGPSTQKDTKNKGKSERETKDDEDSHDSDSSSSDSSSSSSESESEDETETPEVNVEAFLQVSAEPKAEEPQETPQMLSAAASSEIVPESSNTAKPSTKSSSVPMEEEASPSKPETSSGSTSNPEPEVIQKPIAAVTEEAMPSSEVASKDHAVKMDLAEIVPTILEPSGQKKDLVISNMDSWSHLDDDQEESKESKEPISQKGNLWQEFKNKDQQNKQREKEREQHEERLKQQIQEQKKREEETKRIERENQEAKKRLAEQEAENEAIKLREAERQRAKEARERMNSSINMNEQSLVMASFEEEISGASVAASGFQVTDLIKLKQVFKEETAPPTPTPNSSEPHDDSSIINMDTSDKNSVE